MAGCHWQLSSTATVSVRDWEPGREAKFQISLASRWPCHLNLPKCTAAGRVIRPP
ncbi:hypothetical protein CABS01_08156 [Colletotrichum abscissum]|uniref:uncharacterized protein n=1 Tax=Colletotrichum abscissum TaxID=1671311 RepID=UPI0027D63A16|nr:uncharacterized protein CABS01_08156 [Colletotrichum abscissum]KAK1508926.1 hypothetical protein CABS01_08156 [Colletotrichum abscissum]